MKDSDEISNIQTMNSEEEAWLAFCPLSISLLLRNLEGMSSVSAAFTLATKITR